MSELLRADTQYKENAQSYNKKEGTSALVLFALDVLLYVLLGFTYKYAEFVPLFLVQAANYIVMFASTLFCIFFVVVGKRKLSTVGLQKTNWLKSLLLGLALGLIITVINSIVSFASGATTFNAAQLGMPMLIFFLSACAEELVYRGYIFTRLRGLFRSEGVSVLISGILFISCHLPVKFIIGGAWSATLPESILRWFLLHLVCTFAYRKYNSLIAPILFHFFYNLSLALFVVA